MSQDDRFAPPGAAVSDVSNAAPKPRTVQLAVTLLWVSFALSFPILVLGAMRDPAAALHPVSIVVTLAFLALGVLLIVRIDQGRNWARWLYLALLAVSIALLWLPGDDAHPPGYFENALTGVGWLLDVAGMWLVFTRPGAGWFARAA